MRAGAGTGTAVGEAMRAVVATEPLARLDYAAVVDAGTLEEVGALDGHGSLRLLIAARVGPVRLIDNCDPREVLIPARVGTPRGRPRGRRRTDRCSDRPTRSHPRKDRLTMRRRMMKSKIHRATVTDANLNYVGSVSIDTELMALADVLPYEQVAVLDIDNGARLRDVRHRGRARTDLSQGARPAWWHRATR